MLRWLFFGLLLVGLGSSLHKGWLVLPLNQLFDAVGLQSKDPQNKFFWHDLILYGPNNDQPAQIKK